MKITVLSVGNIKEKYLKDAIEEYSKRISKYSKVEFVKINDEPINDNPSDKVPTTTLSALPYTSGSFDDLQLYNLCWDGSPFEDKEIGSYFHNGEWDMLDQIIVSGALLNGNLSVRVMPEAEVYHPKWISKRDKRTGEMVPRRTYVGPFYQGGISDHFPVFIELFFKTEL